MAAVHHGGGGAKAGLVVREHGVRVGLALGGVGRGDGVDDGLGFFVADFWGTKCQ